MDSYPFHHHWADFLTIVGFPLAVIGFWVTIRDARKAKSAAEIAAQEVDQLRKLISHLDIVDDLSVAINEMEEIKRSQRIDSVNWLHLLDKCANARKRLLHVHTAGIKLTDPQRINLQAVITNLSSMEQNMEKRRLKSPAEALPSNTITVMSNQIDKLYSVLYEIKLSAGGTNV